MSDFYCSGCSKWAWDGHDCPGRDVEAVMYSENTSALVQRRKLENRKAELEKELAEVNARLGLEGENH